jgi:hypothetical protein
LYPLNCWTWTWSPAPPAPPAAAAAAPAAALPAASELAACSQSLRLIMTQQECESKSCTTVLMLGLVLLVLAACTAAREQYDALSPPLQRMPQVHFTPPCFRTVAGPHDIAAALWDPKNATYTVMPGCWRAKPGGWQQITSKDLVSFELVGEPKGLGGSGGLLIDDAGDMVAYSGSVSMWRAPASAFYKPENSWKREAGFKQAGGGDPVIWKDERDGRYYAITANGRGGSGANPQGTGFEPMWSSPALHGNLSDWQPLAAPFLRTKYTAIDRVGNWTRPREFVTPDFFPLGDPTSAPYWVFLTTDYGLCGSSNPQAVDLPGCGVAQGTNFTREFDYASYYIGRRPAPGASFEPEPKAGVWDWSPFVPASDGGNKLAFATSKGMEQFGCCPKTAGGPNGRRVLFGWINNGWDQGTPEPHGLEPDRPRPQPGEWLSNNTMSLPRDLSYAGGGIVAQAFVPELQKLRRGHTTISNVSLLDHTVQEPLFLPEAAFGPQLEIYATFRFPSAKSVDDSTCQFGLLVLASNASSLDSSPERTVIRFDLRRQMVMLDRSHSGATVDADVRAGPLPAQPAATTSHQRRGNSTLDDVAVHMYVDHAVVSLIAANLTAISAWVAPQRAESIGVGVFSACGGAAIRASVDVWQLSTPVHR